MRKLVLLILASVIVVSMTMPATAQQRGDGIRDYHKVKDTVTVDSAIGGNWKVIDSLVAKRDDSGVIVIHFQAQAYTNALFGGLYVALGNDSANRVSAATAATTGQTHENFDTAYFGWPPSINEDALTPLNINYVWFDTASTASGKTDTYYVNCATKAAHTNVMIKKMRLWAEIVQKDSL